MIPKSVVKYRHTYQTTVLPRYYSGVAHALFASGVLGGAVIYYALKLDHVTWKEALAFPVMLVFGNFFEYILHRYPLHNVLPGFKELYKIHAGQHHQYYTDEAISFSTTKDLILVFFPWWSPVLAVVVTSALAHWVVGPLTSPNVGYIVALVSPAFFLLYEVMHFIYHLSDNNPIVQLPVIRSFRRHHMIHHNLRIMKNVNFNVTFPLFDWVFNTSTSRLP